MSNKPPYRFTSDDFISFYGEDTRQAIVRIANEKLAEWEAESAVVNGSFLNDLGWNRYPDRRDTHQAFLWRPEEIKKC